MDIREAKRIDDLEREVKARGEILNAIIGEGNCWLSCADLDWKTRLRDFACDREQHRMKRKDWKVFQSHGVTLFLNGNFATAYYDDAAELWDRADDEHPMFHVMAESDPPHRTCIHLIHLVNWIVLLTGACIPVQVVDMQFVESDE